MSLREELVHIRFLLRITGVVCLGTVVELLMIEHSGSWIQLVPIVSASVGLLLSMFALRDLSSPIGFRHSRTFRGVMSALIVVSLVGVFQHVRANYLFVREIKPANGAGEAFIEALTGASPLLASGILALAGACGLMASRPPRVPSENQDSVR